MAFSRFVWPGFAKQRAPGYLSKTYGNWAIITGASAGLGREYAIELAKEGINSILVARRKEKLEEIAQEIKEKYKVEARIIICDLSTPEGPYELHKAVKELNLDVGFLFNNAGVGFFGYYEKQDLKNITQMLYLNVFSVTILTKLFIDDFNKRSLRSANVLISSISAYYPSGITCLYEATKTFVSYLGIGLWGEYKHGKGLGKIDFCVVEPGATGTDFGEVAGVVNARDRKKTLTSPTFVVNATLNSLAEKRVNVIPVHSDYFMTYATWLPREIGSAITFKTFAGRAGMN